MNWEILIGVGVPGLGAVVLLVNKLTSIDTKLNFLQKTVENLILRMDRYDEQYRKRRRKK